MTVLGANLSNLCILQKRKLRLSWVLLFLFYHKDGQDHQPIAGTKEPGSIGNTPQPQTNNPGPALKADMLVTFHPVTFFCRKCNESCYLFISDS